MGKKYSDFFFFKKWYILCFGSVFRDVFEICNKLAENNRVVLKCCTSDLFFFIQRNFFFLFPVCSESAESTQFDRLLFSLFSD